MILQDTAVTVPGRLPDVGPDDREAPKVPIFSGP
jgi:hypothetical protein